MIKWLTNLFKAKTKCYYCGDNQCDCEELFEEWTNHSRNGETG